MGKLIRLAAWLVAGAVAGCATPPPLQGAATTADLLQPRFKAVLVAGDSSIPVFDNATAAMRDWLAKRGTPAGSIQRLSATPAVIGQDGVRTATLDLVDSAIAGMRPGPGQACLVFATSHGAPGRGLYLSAFKEFLTPNALDAALVQGCGDAPTVVVMSGCYAGSFAQAPVARPNRVVLTAARADRTSFGCGAGRRYTYYDECLLAALDTAATWHDADADTKACVTRKEAGSRSDPSEPQASFGSQVGTLALPRPPNTKNRS